MVLAEIIWYNVLVWLQEHCYPVTVWLLGCAGWLLGGCLLVQIIESDVWTTSGLTNNTNIHSHCGVKLQRKHDAKLYCHKEIPEGQTVIRFLFNEPLHCKVHCEFI